MSTDIYQHDKRSRKSLFLSSIEWKECREDVKDYMEKGYGFQVVPPLKYVDSESRDYLIYSIVNLAHEMIHRGHEVIFLKKRDVESDIEYIIREIIARGVGVEVREC